MTFDERVRALEPLGFSPMQTRFLVTVALHSGFCLRRHYTKFAGLKYGQGVRDFLDRLVARRLARRTRFRPDRGHVYHLFASSIYAAICQDDNRNRRRTSPALVARKLMLLDFVLSEPAVDWYATEHDKVALFTGRFGIAARNLPQRIYLGRRRAQTIRSFVHKMPIFLIGDPPVVSFVFLVTDLSGVAFGQFLNDHLRLLTHLPEWRIVLVAPQHIPGIPACDKTLHRLLAALRKPRPQDEVDKLRKYFTVRDLAERNQITKITAAQIDEYHRLRPRFTSPQFEGLFRQWQIEGDAALGHQSAAALLTAVLTGRGRLISHRLPIRYDRFGSRPGVS